MTEMLSPNLEAIELISQAIDGYLPVTDDQPFADRANDEIAAAFAQIRNPSQEALEAFLEDLSDDPDVSPEEEELIKTLWSVRALLLPE
jgi:predicted RNase H-like HicB family nuclease